MPVAGKHPGHLCSISQTNSVWNHTGIFVSFVLPSFWSNIHTYIYKQLYIYIYIYIIYRISFYILHKYRPWVYSMDHKYWLSEWVKVAQSCPTLCDSMDYRVHGILQATILEWVAFSFSRGSSQPRDRTQVSHIAGGFFTSWATKEAQYWLKCLLFK